MAYSTLAGPGSCSLIVRRSRFLGYAAPVTDVGELQALLADIRSRHHDARHVPHAWIGVDGATRMSDDGEPGGTGGRPCLGALSRADVRGAAVAVARIFGGVPLGAANLGRAYGEAAAAAVEAAGTRIVEPGLVVRIAVAYADLDRAERALQRLGAQVRSRDFAAGPSLEAWVSLAALAQLRGELPHAAIAPVEGA
jgi:putative IMPACT (imprinted ancient) family translation regulator